MQKETYNAIRTLILALIIGVGTMFAYGGWNEATSTPAGDNTDSPIQTSTSIQSKSGNLKIHNDIETGTVSTDILSVFGTSYFGDDLAVGDAEFDTPSVDAHVTGKVGVNKDEDLGFILSPDVELDVNGTGRFSDLSSVENVGATYPAKLCVTTDGTLSVCPPAPVLTANIATPTISNQEHQTLPGDDDICDADVSLSGSGTGGNWPYTYSWRVKNNTPTPNVEIEGVEMGDNEWRNVGTAPVEGFHVQVRNPGDSWTAELTLTDDDAVVDVATLTFGVWNIVGCN